jgi:hypothetical protein
VLIETTIAQAPMTNKAPTINDQQAARPHWVLRLGHSLVMGIWALGFSGCAAPANDAQRTQTGDRSGTASMSMSQSGYAVDDQPRDALPPVTYVFQVDVYQLAVPFGTISANEPFWRRIDEQCVDVATHDLLDSNGIRVGCAPLEELQELRKYLAEVTPAQRLTVTASDVRNVEIPMKKDLPEQVLFRFDEAKRPIGYSFDRCENVMAIAFQPTPRRPGWLRLTLCPVVRSQKKVLSVSPTNEFREYAFVNPERLYDLNLTADVPRESFLIVTASSYASEANSVGRAFLTLDGPAQRMEQVLLILPRPYVALDGVGGQGK